MKIKKAQINNSFPSQSIEDYYTNGPSKTEVSSEDIFMDPDTKYVLDFISVKRLYNKLREDGETHAVAWKKSKAFMLPIGDQLEIKREIQDKNPGFYQEHSLKLELYSKSAKIVKKSLMDNYWNIVYTEEDIKKLEH